MTINSTLIIQALNFFVVYLFLRYFFLKPVCTVIQEHDDQRQDCIRTREEARRKSEELDLQRQEAWRTCQDYFGHYAPGATGYKEPVTVELPAIEPFERLSPQDHKKITHEVAHTLVEKVKHVR